LWLKRPNILSLLIATKDQAWEVLNQQYKNHDTAYGTKRMFIFLNDTLWFEKYIGLVLDIVRRGQIFHLADNAELPNRTLVGKNY
ncbi:hypothetical protein ACJX0J_025169, partial [Zea mays]